MFHKFVVTPFKKRSYRSEIYFHDIIKFLKIPLITMPTIKLSSKSIYFYSYTVILFLVITFSWIIFLPSRAFCWDGLYFGINGGYGVAKLNGRQSNYSWMGNSYNYISPYNDTYFSYYNSGNYQGNTTKIFGASGSSAGGQVGYIFATPEKLLIGPEVSINWTNIGIEGSWEENRNSIFNYNGYSFKSGMNWLGNGIVRVGYDMGDFFPYLGVGLSFGRASHSSNAMISSIYSWGNDFNAHYDGSSYSGNKISVGLAASGGLEAKISNNLSIKGEYLYSELGGARIYGGSICDSCNLFTSYKWPSQTTDRLAAQQIRVGLNYHLSKIENHKLAIEKDTRWTGLYIGAHGGYSGGYFKLTRESETYGGALAGGQIGINYEFANRLVVGLELSGSWTNLMSGSKNISNYLQYAYSGYKYNNNPDTWFSALTYSGGNYSSANEFRWLGLSLFKSGISFGKFMPYLQGGGVATSLYATSANTSSSFYIIKSNCCHSAPSVANSYYSPYSSSGSNKTVFGGALGAGIEYRLSDNISFKTDYLYWNTRGPWIAQNRMGNHQVRGGFNLFVWSP